LQRFLFTKYNYNYKLILFGIPVISLILHWHIFDLDLVGIHVWRQTETQTVINNFYRDDFNILHPRYNQNADTNRLHRMEFPIMQWIFALFYKLIGPHIYISRILTFFIGLCSVYGMFRLCDNIFKNREIAAICAWCFNWSPVFYYYTLNPMPDNLALCFGIWSACFFYAYLNTLKTKQVIWSAIFLGLASLVKLPFILYGSYVFVFLIVQVKRNEYTKRQLVTIFLNYVLFVVPAITWYLLVIPEWQNGVVKGAFDIKQSLHEWLNILYGNIVSVLPELLLNYGSAVFFIAGFYFLYSYKLHKNKKFYLFLFWGVSIILYFIYELNMIDTVHDYYLFPFLPLIFLLVAFGAYHLLLKKGKFSKSFTMLCLCILPLTAFLRIDSRWDTKDPGFNPSYFKYKKELQSLTPQNSYCIVGNDPSGYILLYYIDRKGWVFDNDKLNENLLVSYISKGAAYLFLDSKIDTIPCIKAHLSLKIFDKGTLRVYKLK